MIERLAADLQPETAINHANIRSRVGQGYYHTVYDYAEACVIKIPKVERLRQPDAYAKVQQDLLLVETYFPHYLPPSRVVPGDSEAPYYIIQEKVNYKPVTCANAGTVWKELLEIARSNQALRQECGMTFDFIGREAVVPAIDPYSIAYLSNIGIRSDTGEVCITDFELYEHAPQRPVPHTEWANVVTNQIVFRVNQFILRQHFSLEI